MVSSYLPRYPPDAHHFGGGDCADDLHDLASGDSGTFPVAQANRSLDLAALDVCVGDGRDYLSAALPNLSATLKVGFKF